MGEEAKKVHEYIYGKEGFLIPLEVLLQSHFKMFPNPGHSCAIRIYGRTVEVEGRLFF
jgi:hypothetical protein